MLSEIAGTTKWEVFNIFLIGSDHYLIMIRVAIEVYEDESTKTAKWNFNEADWDTFKIINKSRCEGLFKKHPTNVEEFNEKLVSTIIETAEETIPKTKEGKGTKSVPWWDGNCRKAVKNRNKAFRQLKKHHSLDVLIQYKRAQAIVRKNMRTAKHIRGISWRNLYRKRNSIINYRYLGND